MTAFIFQGINPFGACKWDGGLDTLWEWENYIPLGAISGSSRLVQPGEYYHFEQKSRGLAIYDDVVYIPLTVELVDYTAATILEMNTSLIGEYAINSFSGRNTDVIAHDIGFRGSSDIPEPTFGNGEIFPVAMAGYILIQTDSSPIVPPTVGPGTPTSTIHHNIYFAEIKDAQYRDWHTAKDTNYISFLDTWWGIQGDAALWAEAPWIITYLDNTDTNPSCIMTPRWEWTDSDINHKSGPATELFINRGTKQSVSDRRNRIRGKGRALQLHFASTANKPFNLLGWSVHLDGNSTY